MSEVSERGGNRHGGRAGHLAIAQRRTILALKSAQMLLLERLEGGDGNNEALERAEKALKEALREFAQVDGT